MKYTLTINQKQALKLGLNLTEAAVLSIIKNNPFADVDAISSFLILDTKKIDTINIILNVLLKKGVINKHNISDIEIFKALNKNHKDGCLFCGVNDITLDNHYYPIRRKDGGEKTIKLCPNCHRRFHMIAEYKPQYTIAGGIK